jgi:hypothetical protein
MRFILSRPARLSLIASGAATAALIGPAAASAATVTVTTSSVYAFIGGTTTVTVKSDTAGTIYVAQERANKSTGPGRCASTQDLSVDFARLRGGARATVNYTTPGKAVTVRFAATSLAYGAGNLFDPTPDTPANADHCFDPWTQFTKVGAILTGPAPAEGVAALTRVL